MVTKLARKTSNLTLSTQLNMQAEERSSRGLDLILEGQQLKENDWNPRLAGMLRKGRRDLKTAARLYRKSGDNERYVEDSLEKYNLAVQSHLFTVKFMRAARILRTERELVKKLLDHALKYKTESEIAGYQRMQSEIEDHLKLYGHLRLAWRKAKRIVGTDILGHEPINK